MLDVCLLGTGGMMPLPLPVPHIPDDQVRRKQSADRLRRGNPGGRKSQRVELPSPSTLSALHITMQIISADFRGCFLTMGNAERTEPLTHDRAEGAGT